MIQSTHLEKNGKLKELKPLSKNQLETIIGGPETSRGTEVKVGT
ncbi:bacteriocin [Flavobacterium collinsii]|nr:bacteriocin [Flavobacterium collinsii]